MDGCFGIAPIISSLCVIDTALAPVPARVFGAGEAADGAAEVSELVWLWGADSAELLGAAEGASGESVAAGVVGAGAAGAVTGTAGVIDADMGLIGLTGLVGLVGLLIDLTHVFDVVCQAFDHTGLP